uniref:VWFA domain-containing protein n=1 Tax=Caenorhabditis tropicalis TaxID=1561998 RepID=A0A1I7TTU4_9PELO
MVTEDTSCTSRTQPPTFLFAYSNDFSQKTILDTWNSFVNIEEEVDLQYSDFGNVRFDTKTPDSIHWNTNYKDVKSSIENNLPDHSLGFGDSSTGSDVLDVLNRYLYNGQVPICGSVVMILLKRYPNEYDITKVVNLIRSHHSIVHVITSGNPSGGSQPKTGYNIALKSNGLGAFEYDDMISDMIPRFPLFATPFPIYTTNVKISGTGSIKLPPMTVPIATEYYISMTYQDHLPLDAFRSIKLEWDAGNFFEDNILAQNSEDGGTYTSGWQYFGSGVTELTFSYEYNDKKVETLQIRISSDTALDHWLPYAE